MIQGQVNARCEAIARLSLRGPSGVELAVDAVVDSGFTASLSLPVSIVTALGLVRQSRGSSILADGSVKQFDIYAASVKWNGRWRWVLAYATGNEVLMGMRLLTGHVLQIEVVPGGTVQIIPMVDLG